MKAKNLLLGATLIAGLVMFNACDNSETIQPLSQDVNTDIAEQDAELEDIVEGVFDELDSYLSSDTETTSAAELKSASEDDDPVGCPTVIVEHPEDAKYPKVITFDYGTENCEDARGRLKRGKVVVTKTGPHWEEGSSRTVEFVDFFVNDNSVAGTRIYKNEGLNEDGNWEFSTDIDVTIETTEEITWTRTADKIRTMIAGADTKYAWDDEFLVTGTSSGTCSEGYSVAREITTPIYRQRTCRFPLSGIVEIIKTKDGVATTTWLDYGEGVCDYLATVTDEDGNVEEITLGKRFKKRK